MKILVIGSGGREHALLHQLAKSPHKPELFVAPGNPGMEALAQRLDIDPTDLKGLRLFAQKEAIDLTVVGPEIPLSFGVVDVFEQHGLLIFGPNQQAAQLESSKAFAKQLMKKYRIPTAGYMFCTTIDQARKSLKEFNPPYVIKEDGLAAGKGVTIADDHEDALVALDRAFSKEMPVVMEEFLPGVELSILAICDGHRALPLISAQDFKKAQDGDQGPNTGGMGAYAPVPLATPELMKTIQAQILDPMMVAFAQEGITYRGILYAGLMINSNNQPSVVEFNVRFGDPETQVVLPLLEDDLVDLLTASAKGDLSAYEKNGIRFSKHHAVTVVLASAGYPGDFEKNIPITAPNSTPSSQILFHAGTKKLPDQTIVSNSGRVFTATGLGDTLEEARTQAYTLCKQVNFANKYHRDDIAAAPSHASVLA